MKRTSEGRLIDSFVVLSWKAGFENTKCHLRVLQIIDAQVREAIVWLTEVFRVLRLTATVRR